MEPRGYWATVSWITPLTGLAFALIQAAVMEVPMNIALVMGLGFGIMIGLVLGFMLKGATMTVPYQDPATFLARLNVAAAEIGYHVETATPTYASYKLIAGGSFSLGPISMLGSDWLKMFTQLNNGTATIVGPKHYLSKL